MATATKHRTRTRNHYTADERKIMQAEALDRAEHGRTCANDLLIIEGFAARGIDAHPRKDCFTFNAWRALGRHVRKGEHGVRVAVYVHTDEVKDDGTTQAHSYPTSATVFHVSQTDPDEPHEGEQPTPAPIAPLTAQEQDTLDAIEATQRQDTEADDREEAEDAHERALLEQEQREEATSTTTADAQPALF